MMERTPDEVRLLGRIWLIERQREESFWLDLAEDDGNCFSWTLHLGLTSFGRGRDVRHAGDLMDAPEQGTWRVVLNGTAALEAREVRVLEVDASRRLSGGAS